MISFLTKTTGKFFYYYGNISPLNKIGLVMYKLSLIALIFILRMNKNIKAVYLATDLTSSDFYVGKSDLDILIIIKKMSVEDEVNFNINFSQYENKLLKIFPFLGSPIDNHFYMFEDNFKLFQEIRHSFIENKGKHFKNWKLIYGLECRQDFKDNETKIDGYRVRYSYEQILVSVYLNVLGYDYDFRMMYKYGRDLFRMFFVFINQKEALDNNEYKKFLKNYGLDDGFLQGFFALPDNNFKSDHDFLILALFNFIKTIETISDHDLENKIKLNDLEIIRDDKFEIKVYPEVKEFSDKLRKDGIKSIYLSQILFIDSYFLYLFLDENLSYQDFRKSIENILGNLHTLKILKNKIKIKLRPAMFSKAPDIFPLIITPKMAGYAKFFDYGFLLQSAFFNLNAQKLFGYDIEVPINSEIINNKRYFYGFEMYNLRIESDSSDNSIDKLKSLFLMMDRLFTEKQKISLTNIGSEYQKNFNDFGFDFNDSRERYLFFRRYVKNNQ